MTDTGLKKCGLVDVKQPAKMKGRKLKSWKKRWLVIHKMSDLAAGTLAAQIDIYRSDEAAKKNPSCKQTIILENLTRIQPAKSKTRRFAVEVVEREPVLLLAGESELESQEWMHTIRQIFWTGRSNQSIAGKDILRATVIESEHTSRLGLKGEYEMHISPEYISIRSLNSHNSYEWSLRTLKRFQLLATNNSILSIECGSSSESGEATFQFMSAVAPDILAAIKKNIFVAISLKQNMQKQASPKETDLQDKSRSNSSTSSEKVLRGMLENCNQGRKESLKLLTLENDAVSAESIPSEISSRKSSAGDSFISSDLPSLCTRLSSVETVQPMDSHNITKGLPSETQISDSASELPPKSEMADVTPPSSEYNTLEEFTSKRVCISTNFSVMPVASDNHNVEVFLDEYGYSHVNIKTRITSTTDDKGRTRSNLSSTSSVSFRTNSTSSKDSGVFVPAIDAPTNNAKTERKTQKSNHRPTDSFDSAISTSSINEVPTHIVKFCIEEVEICPTPQAYDSGKDYGYSVLYQHKKDHTKITDSSKTAAQHRRPSLQKSNSTGNFATEENIYEDVDKYRKNLEKFLGLDPKVDPSDIPPSLPERPPPLKSKRKIMNQEANPRSLERKLFALPKLSKSKGKKRDSSSSESDEESAEFRKGPLKVSVWPLGAKSVTDDNELYQEVAKVNRPVARERSNSLSLSFFPTRRKKSREQQKRDSVDLLTGNNLPEFLSSPVKTKVLRPEIFGPNSNSTPHNKENGINMDWAEKQNSHVYRQDVSLFDDLLSPAEAKLHNYYSFSEEPIYAEVKPRATDKAPLEPPFPDIANWYPQLDCMDTEIQEPEMINKSDLAVLDFFHFGFSFPVSEKTRNREENNEESSLSIGNIVSQTSIFLDKTSQNSGVSNAYLMTPGIHDWTSKIATYTESTENIYLDMSACPRDDVYVLPSDMQTIK